MVRGAFGGNFAAPRSAADFGAVQTVVLRTRFEAAGGDAHREMQ